MRVAQVADMLDQTLRNDFCISCRRDTARKFARYLSRTSSLFFAFFSLLNTVECTHLRGRVHACVCMCVCTHLRTFAGLYARILGGQLHEKRIEKREKRLHRVGL